MKVFYFTGTGNSLQVAREIGMGGDLVSIPQWLRHNAPLDKRVTIADDAIGLVFPTYWQVMPAVVESFLQRVDLQTDYLFAVTTRGMLSLTVKAHLLDVFRKNRQSLAYFAKLNMPDNYLPTFEISSQMQRFNQEKLKQQIDAVSSDISSRRRNVNGFTAMSLLLPLLSRFAEGQSANFSRVFYLGENCDGCGTCTMVCSAQVIQLAEGRPQYGDGCNACLACVHNCPNVAIHMRSERSSARYRNPAVSLSDIIDANG